MPAIFRHNGSILINDYILDCDLVAVTTEKNRDCSLVASQFDFVISDKYTKPAKGDIIKVYSDSSTTLPFFSGLILKVLTDYNNRTYAINVINDFYRLMQTKLTYENLHTQLLQTSSPLDYLASDNFGLPNVSVLYAIKSMFLAAGMNLEISNAIKEEILETITYVGNNYDMRIQDLVFDENVLYAINQMFAISKNGINSDYEKVNLQITFFDFISEFCSHVGAHIYPYIAGTPGHYIINLAGLQLPSYFDDKIYSKEINEISGSGMGYIHNLQFNSDRTKYNISTETALAEHQFLSGDGKDLIDTYTNWIYMYRKLGAMGGNPGDVLGHAYPSLCWNADSFLQNKIKSVINGFREITYEVDVYLPKNTKSAKLDMNRQEAELVWSEVL